MFIKVIVTPGAKKESVREVGEALHLSVREPAEQNRANDRVREILAARAQVRVSQVRILTGHRSRSKMISISDSP